MGKINWYSIAAFAISIAFNIYQLFDGHNNKIENKNYQSELEMKLSNLSKENQQLLFSINEQGELLKQYNLSKEDQKRANEILITAKKLAVNISQNGCISNYPKPKIAGGCLEEPCNWLASASELKLKDSQFGVIYLNDGSVAYIQRCGSIIHAIEKDKRGDPPSVEQLNRFRIPQSLLGISRFKQISQNLWSLE